MGRDIHKIYVRNKTIKKPCLYTLKTVPDKSNQVGCHADVEF